MCIIFPFMVILLSFDKRRITQMKWFDNTALTLVIIGALNWLLVGIFKLDIVAVIFGNLTWISRIIYTIIGLCGLYLISLYGRIGSSS